MENYKSVPFKLWEVSDLPTTKIVEQGTPSLSNAELLSIIVGKGTKDFNPVDISRMLLNMADNDLHRLKNLNVHELSKIHGISVATAKTLAACFELSRRINTQSPKEVAKINNSETAVKAFKEHWESWDVEHFYLMTLTRAHKVIRVRKISTGGMTGTVIDVRLILKAALEDKATSILVAHNHPSGNSAPSIADATITKKISDSAKLMDINLLDHIIMTEHHSYHSMADNGEMQNN